MNDQTRVPLRSAPTGKILVTGASGAVGMAVVDALAAAGEAVVAGMRDPRAWIAEGARRASGTAAGQQPDGHGTGSTATGRLGTGRSATGRPGSARTGAGLPAGKPVRAPNQKPSRNPAHKPARTPNGLAAATPPGRTIGRSGPGVAAGPVRPGGASAATGVSTPLIDGAEVRAFDFADQSTWARALAGVDRVFLTLPPTVSDVGRTLVPFIDQAMEESGVRQIVFLSAPGVRFDTRSAHHRVEQYLKRTRTPYTILRPNLVMQNLGTRYRDDIRLRHEIVLPAAGARAAFVDADDLGRVAARVFTAPGHLQKAYTVSGEQSLSFAQVAQTLSEVLDRPIRYTPAAVTDYRALAEKQGLAPGDIAAQSQWFRAMRRRLTALPNRSVRRLTGRPATTLRDFAERHRQSWL